MINCTAVFELNVETKQVSPMGLVIQSIYDKQGPNLKLIATVTIFDLLDFY